MQTEPSISPTTSPVLAKMESQKLIHEAMYDLLTAEFNHAQFGREIRYPYIIRPTHYPDMISMQYFRNAILNENEMQKFTFNTTDIIGSIQTYLSPLYRSQYRVTCLVWVI